MTPTTLIPAWLLAVFLHLSLALAATGASPAQDAFVTVCRDGGAGAYEAFPDVCRLADGRLFCVFYASYAHVGIPNATWPAGGKIAGCWSGDEGKSWSQPITVFDSSADDRDPSITALPDGRLFATFFTDRGVHWIESRSPNGPWSAPKLVAEGVGVSSPVRVCRDGGLMLGAYYEKENVAYGLVVRSHDGGQSWGRPVKIDSNGAYLDAETDVIESKPGQLYAALRGGRGAPMHFARSQDAGRTWTKAMPLSFTGHCPYLHATADGTWVLAYRQPSKGPTYGTALRVSRDRGNHWGEERRIDSVIGAYPSLVNLKDGTCLVVYYEEGAGSNIRARRFRLGAGQVEWLAW